MPKSMNSFITVNSGICALATLCLISFCNTAWAQQISTEFEADTYETVIVTAQKREQKISEVPIAISSFSAENIQQTGITQLAELSDFIPNVSISRDSNFISAITVRGVGAFSRNIGFDTRVGVYLDGVYLGQSPALNQELLDLTRVEVLRGPQGTLFGKNTVAGAINLISAKPSDMLEGKAVLSVGNLNAREFKGLLNMPISDTVALRMSYSDLKRDGYIDNIITNNEVNERDASAYRAQLRADLSNQLQLNFTVDGMYSDRLAFVGEALTDTLGMTLDMNAPEKYQVATTIDAVEERDIWGAMLNLAYSMSNGFHLKSISAYRDTEATYSNDTDYAVIDLLNVDYADQYQQWSQEFQLISPDQETPFNYVAGLYLYTQDGLTRRDAINGEFSIAIGNEPGSIVHNSGKVVTDSYAAYFNSGFDISSDQTLALGLRYTKEEKDLNWVLDGSKSGVFGIGSTEGNLRDTRSDAYVSYAISYNHTFDDDINTYAKYSTGFKSGGFNVDYITDVALSAGIEFDKETVDSAELGLKTNFKRNQLSLNMAAFRSEFENYQVNQFIDLGNGTSTISIRNAAKATSQGVEIELIYYPVDNLTIATSLGLLDTEYEDFPGGLTDGGNAKGKDLINAPELTASLSTQYLTSVAGLNADILLRADVSHSTGFFTTVDNTKRQILANGTEIEFGYVDHITLINTRIGLLFNNSGWEAYVWARNLGNFQGSIDNRKDFFGTVTTNYAEPRTFGVEVIYQF